MSQQSNKSAYCSNCTKNVPHLRTKLRPAAMALEQWFGWFFDLLNIGPWYCLHCHRKMLILPSVNLEAENYRIVDPLDLPDHGIATIWSKASSKPSLSVQTTSRSRASESAKPLVKSSSDTLEQNSVIDLEPATERDLRDTKNINWPDKNSGAICDILQRQNVSDLDALLRPSKSVEIESVSSEERESLRRIDQMTKKHKNELPAAELVGNFIKDRSLILRSTRMHRVSVKYRDSVVERILSGNVSIGQLTSAGEYTEGELVSWIADKVKRLNARIEELEDSCDRNWEMPNPNAGTFGPFGPR